MARAGFGGPRKVSERGHVKGPDGKWYKESGAFASDGDVYLAKCYNENGGKPRMMWCHHTNLQIRFPKVKNDVVRGLNVKNGKIVQGDDS